MSGLAGVVVALVALAVASARVSMSGLHVQGNALVNGDGVGVLIHVMMKIGSLRTYLGLL